ncbi:MAG: beta-lactamase family protein [Phycisphaerales bacterium]|nr:MAG: beta-lactamase family protein [Phycisphaerales bacterium]
MPRKLLSDARSRLLAFCQENDSPGATLGFVLADGRTGAVAAGKTRKTGGRAMEPTDRMFSGSIGKTYVSAVLLQLAEEGRVELDEKIAHWFGEKEWFARLPNASDITLRMLLNHTTGIPRHIMTPEMQARVRQEPQKVWRPEELIAFVLDKEPLFPVGKGWAYADTNYILVGMIIEQVTGRTYYDELTDRILRPLTLDETSPADRPDLPGLVSGYTSPDNIFSMPEEVAVNGRYAVNPQLEWTGGGLIGTARDLARWAWLLYGRHVLADTSIVQLLEGVPTDETSGTSYGLGVFIRNGDLGLTLGHAGWVPGYVSQMTYYADHGVAVAVQVNNDVGMSRGALRGLLDSVAGDLIRQHTAP